MSCERVQLVDSHFFVPAARPERPAAAPEAQTAEARELVESWLATEFVGRGDAVEELVARIARRLAERDARPRRPAQA